MRRLHISVLILTIVLLGGLFGFSLVKNDFVPVARVNGDFIALKTIKENVDVSIRLYASGLVADDTYSELFAAGSEELFRSAFESLIVATIIDTNASPDTHQEAEVRIDEAIGPEETAALGPLIEDFHNWDFGTFRKRILKPQALQDILVEQKGEEDYEKWLAGEIAKANVSIWLLPFEWQEGKLRKK